MELPLPSVEYTYSWSLGEGPEGTAVGSSLRASITKVTITEFPESNEEADLSSYGQVMTTKGDRDGRHTYAKLCWLDHPQTIWKAHDAMKARIGHRNGSYSRG